MPPAEEAQKPLTLWDLVWAHREIGWVSHDLLGRTKTVLVGGVMMPLADDMPLTQVETECRRLWQSRSAS